MAITTPTPNPINAEANKMWTCRLIAYPSAVVGLTTISPLVSTTSAWAGFLEEIVKSCFLVISHCFQRQESGLRGLGIWSVTAIPLLCVKPMQYNCPMGRVWASPATAKEQRSTDFSTTLLIYGDWRAGSVHVDLPKERKKGHAAYFEQQTAWHTYSIFDVLFGRAQLLSPSFMVHLHRLHVLLKLTFGEK